MSKHPKTQQAQVPPAGVMAAIAAAQAAAERASVIAADTSVWAGHCGVGEDDAAEATRAALRARLAAEEAERATDVDQAWEIARRAWAAAASGEEASARVTLAIAESLASATPQA